MYKNIVSSFSNNSIYIIPHCINFSCTQFDLCDLFNLKYNRNLHQILKTDVYVKPSVPVIYCINLWLCLQHI